jgi:small subunit ribosomal protein S16
MLVIRFFRVGKKNQPSFKIVVTDKRRAPRGGRFTEEVGFWNPLTKQRTLKEDRVKYWLSVGAQPSDTVHNLLIEAKVLEGKKVPVHKVKKGAVKPEGEKPKPPASGVAKPAEVKAPEATTAPVAAAVPATPEVKEAPKEEKPKETPKEEKPAEVKPQETKTPEAPAASATPEIK